jgi:hypothetical protein
MVICSRCNLEKEETSFCKKQKRKDGSYRKSTICYSCTYFERLKKITNQFKQTKKKAKDRNINFLLTEEEFCSIEKICFYCGESLERIKIDRVDNNKGYEKENVVGCCTTCNFMKGTMDSDKFKLKIEEIFLWQQKRKKT